MKIKQVITGLGLLVLGVLIMSISFSEKATLENTNQTILIFRYVGCIFGAGLTISGGIVFFAWLIDTIFGDKD